MTKNQQAEKLESHEILNYVYIPRFRSWDGWILWIDLSSFHTWKSYLKAEDVPITKM